MEEWDWLENSLASLQWYSQMVALCHKANLNLSRREHLKRLKLLAMECVTINLGSFVADVGIVPNPTISLLPSSLRQELIKHICDNNVGMQQVSLFTKIRAIAALVDSSTKNIPLKALQGNNPLPEFLFKVLAQRAKNLQVLSINIPYGFLNFLEYVPTLTNLEITCSPNFGDKAVDLISNFLPGLISFKCYLDPAHTTVVSLYFLQRLKKLQIFEFEGFRLTNDEQELDDLYEVLISQILHILPNLKVAGKRADVLKDDVEYWDQSTHIVPLKPLALEHLINFRRNFSQVQASMIPNLKALKICGGLMLSNFLHFPKLESLYLVEMDNEQMVTLLSVYGSRLKHLFINKALEEFDLWQVLDLCMNLESLIISNTSLGPPATLGRILHPHQLKSLKNIYLFMPNEQFDGWPGHLPEGLLPQLMLAPALSRVAITCSSILQNDISTVLNSISTQSILKKLVSFSLELTFSRVNRNYLEALKVHILAYAPRVKDCEVIANQQAMP